MCRKSFTIATFVRHSISKLPDNYYSLPTGIIEYHIAIGKGFFAYMPVINRNFRVNARNLMHDRARGNTAALSVRTDFGLSSSRDSLLPSAHLPEKP